MDPRQLSTKFALALLHGALAASLPAQDPKKVSPADLQPIRLIFLADDSSFGAHFVVQYGDDLMDPNGSRDRKIVKCPDRFPKDQGSNWMRTDLDLWISSPGK